MEKSGEGKTTQEIGKGIAGQAGKEVTEKGVEEAAKQTGKKVVTTGLKEGAKGVVRTGEALTGAESAGAGIVIGEVINKIIDGLFWFWDKYGDKIVKIILWFILAIIATVAFIVMLASASIYGRGLEGKEGGQYTEDLVGRDRDHYQDVLADLALAGSREDKLKLLIDKSNDIKTRLENEKISLKKIAPDKDTEESVKLIDEMLPNIKKIGELGKQIDNTEKKTDKEKIDQEKKNKKIIEEINKEYDKWLQNWEKFTNVYPGFKSPKYVDEYINYLKKFGINTYISSNFYAWRNDPKRDYEHKGYDLPYSDGSPAITAWDGKVAKLVYWDFAGQGDYGVHIEHGSFEIIIGHVIPTVDAGDTVKKDDIIGYIRNGHVDIKVKLNGAWYDWGINPIY